MNNFSNDFGLIILAGGQSKRMGTCKSNLDFGHKTVLQHIVHNLKTITDTIVVVCASAENRPVVFDDVLWAYDAVGDQGPLRGLEAGLMALPPGVGRTFVSSCDAPLMVPELVAHLLSTPTDKLAVVPQIAGFAQPLVAAYATCILPIVKKMLAEGERSLRALLRQIDTEWVSEAAVKQIDRELLSFESINTPEDYQRVLDIYRQLS